MKKVFFILAVSFSTLFLSCKKAIDAVVDHGSSPVKGQVIRYVIRQGQHYSDQNGFQEVEYSQLNFTVRFDSSAIYQTTDPANQEDINKLYGFSDNNADHEQFSARFGWNWARGALRLYGYVYNNGQRTSQEITPIKIGTEYNCSITVSADHYVFNSNDTTINLPRTSATAKGEGYRLFPYFGGDETAPHEIDIWIKEL
jgi:hypothetical protein